MTLFYIKQQSKRQWLYVGAVMGDQPGLKVSYSLPQACLYGVGLACLYGVELVFLYGVGLVCLYGVGLACLYGVRLACLYGALKPGYPCLLAQLLLVTCFCFFLFIQLFFFLASRKWSAKKTPCFFFVGILQ